MRFAFSDAVVSRNQNEEMSALRTRVRQMRGLMLQLAYFLLERRFTCSILSDQTDPIMLAYLKIQGAE
jgi:hypothetical protein